MSGVVRSLFVSCCFVLALAAGCVGTDSVQCDGWTCPPGTTCGSGTLRCINPEQLTACEGLADYTPCTAPSIQTGQCIDQVCVPAGCGNSKLDPGEVCDDGNTAPRDGCSSDCRSDETCGNSIID